MLNNSYGLKDVEPFILKSHWGMGLSQIWLFLHVNQLNVKMDLMVTMLVLSSMLQHGSQCSCIESLLMLPDLFIQIFERYHSTKPEIDIILSGVMTSYCLRFAVRILSRVSEVGSPTNPPWAPGSNKTRGQGSFGPSIITYTKN